ncbi:MAG: hypothetical protein FWD38_03250 [Oscillospiraceae bacterium]|nr:hypothetical protein [Oscillospiraceae bacterium]
MTNRSKSTLFLIEQLIVIAVFAICAVACISILTASYFYANDSSALSHAIIKAESGAEVFKITGTDFSAAAEILDGTVTSKSLGADGVSVIAVYYNSSWQTSSEDNASYVMNLIIEAAQGPQNFDVITGRITVERTTGEELISLSVAARDY